MVTMMVQGKLQGRISDNIGIMGPGVYQDQGTGIKVQGMSIRAQLVIIRCQEMKGKDEVRMCYHLRKKINKIKRF